MRLSNELRFQFSSSAKLSFNSFQFHALYLLIFGKHENRSTLSNRLICIFSSDYSLLPDTVVVIGPDRSELARSVTDFTSLFKVPVISPAATSASLSDRERYKYFLRTLPSDTYQVQIIFEIIKYYGWDYVMLLVSDDDYGRSARRAFKRLSNNSKSLICIVIDEIVTRSNSEEIITKIKAEKKSKIIVLISSLDEAIYLAKLSSRHELRGYTWIASDAWSKDMYVVSSKEKVFNGMLGVSPLKIKVPSYQVHLSRLLKLKPLSGWMKEYQEFELNNSCVGNIVSECIKWPGYEATPYEVATTMNAVYAVAHALKMFLECDENLCKQDVRKVDWTKLITTISNIRYAGVGGEIISFDDSGGGPVKYNLWNLQQKGNVSNFVEVGEWKGKGAIDSNFIPLNIYGTIQWNGQTNMTPVSICSTQCSPGKRFKKISVLIGYASRKKQTLNQSGIQTLLYK